MAGEAVSVSVPGVGQVKLGAILAKSPKSALRFAAYFDPAEMTIPPPARVDYSEKAMASLRRMYLNNQYGDCVIAGKMHQLGIYSGNDSDSGGIVLATDQEVLSQYTQICGPGDRGCIITDVLDEFRSRGLVASGKYYRIDGYVAVDWTNRLEVQVAILLFGSLTLGIKLPKAWTTTPDGGKWDVTNTQIVGGHDVATCGYNDTGVVISTWGGLRTITWAAFQSRNWLVECYAQLAPLWYGNDMMAPCGVDASTLKADLEKLGGGTIPPLPDPNTPPTIDMLRAVPSTIQLGGQTRIEWATTGATQVALNGNPQTELDGFNMASPVADKDYSLTATGPGGTVTQTVRVTVEGAPPPPADVIHVKRSQQVIIDWD